MTDRNADKYIEVVPIGIDVNDERRRHIFIKKSELKDIKSDDEPIALYFGAVFSSFADFSKTMLTSSIKMVKVVDGDNLIPLEEYMKLNKEDET